MTHLTCLAQSEGVPQAQGRALSGSGRNIGYGLCLVAILWWPFIACGAEIGLAGVFPGKALLTINGGALRAVAVGAKTSDGIRVIAVEGDTATIEVDGKRRVLRVGQYVATRPPSEEDSGKIVLTANSQGHFVTTGYINGAAVRFLVDTGATTIAIGAGDARRIGLDTSKGVRGTSQTANGSVTVTMLKLDSVRVGDVVMNNVDATIHERDLPVTLLGMSFLNRMEMQRSGGTMTLIRRY